MPRYPQASRLAAPLAAAVLVAFVSGCSLFGKKDELYTQSGESRPLEVPPDLDRPSADRAMALPASGGSVSASGTNTAGSSAVTPIGFNATGDGDAIFAQVGQVLGATSGVSVSGSAQSLGIFDVDYMGTKFLVRVTKIAGGAYVSAVDARGLPPAGEAPVKLIAALKAAIAP